MNADPIFDPEYSCPGSWFGHGDQCVCELLWNRATAMYEPHESLPFPRDKRVQLWRYMDFTKYVAMLESRCLYFCRADHLGDPYESSMPLGMVKKYTADIHKLTEENTESSLAKAKVLRHNLSFFYQWSRAAAVTMYINCWHINKHESDAMWKVYLKGSEGVAVQSSPGRLVKSIEANDERISIGKVVYADYEKLDLHGKDGGFNLLNFRLFSLIPTSSGPSRNPIRSHCLR